MTSATVPLGLGFLGFVFLVSSLVTSGPFADHPDAFRFINPPTWMLPFFGFGMRFSDSIRYCSVLQFRTYWIAIGLALGALITSIVKVPVSWVLAALFGLLLAAVLVGFIVGRAVSKSYSLTVPES